MPIETGNRALCDTTFTLTAEQTANPASPVSVSLCCRIVNAECAPLVGAVLRFVLPPDIIVAPNEPAAIALEPIEPGAERTIARVVTVHASTVNAAELPFSASLSCADGQLLRTNVAVTRVVRRARLDGPETRAYVEPTSVAGQFFVVAQIVNDGTSSAHDITLDVPLPAGTEAVDPAAATLTCDELLPGESRSFTRHVRVTDGTLHCLQAAGVRIHDGAGTTIAIAPSPPLALPASLAAPVLHVARVGRRMQVTVRGSNTGAGSASGVGIAIGWPATFRCSVASLTWNAARVTSSDNPNGFARALVRDNGADLAIAAIDAGESYELTFALDPTSTAQAGLLTVGVSTHATTASAQCVLDWSPHTEIRLRPVAQPLAAVDAGSTARFAVDIFNAGDNDTEICFEVDGTVASFLLADEPCSANDPQQPNAAISVAAGERRLVTFSIVVAGGRGDGHVFTSSLDAYVADERVATLPFAVGVRRLQCDNGSLPADTDGLLGSIEAHVADHTARVALAADTELESPAKAVTFSLPLDRERIDLCRQALSAQRGSDLFAHMCGLRPFLVTTVHGSDESMAGRLQTAVGAVYAMLDRLALKQRLPNVSLSGRDCDDGRVRSSLLALLGTIAGSTSALLPPPDRRPALHVTIESKWAERQLAQLGGSPLGDRVALLTIVALVPSTTTGPAILAAALCSYTAALRTALAIESPWAEVAGSVNSARSRLVAALVSSSNGLGSELVYAS